MSSRLRPGARPPAVGGVRFERLMPFAVLIVPNLAMLALALWSANIREYLINIDYLVVVLLLSLARPGRRGMPVLVLGGHGSASSQCS